jgi:protein-S-isoprenylcysteine O-methyltransferase Ste14
MLLLVCAPELRRPLLFLFMTWGGYALVAIGVLGRIYCSAFIGGRKNETIVRHGPFSVVRNPLYVFSFLATLGIGLQSDMISIAALLVVTYIAYYRQVVKKEEAFLLHKFGEPYQAYMNEVPRWIPNMKLWSEPEYVEVMPKFLRKTALDASIFFLPMPMFAFLQILHRRDVLPVWLILP